MCNPTLINTVSLLGCHCSILGKATCQGLHLLVVSVIRLHVGGFILDDRSLSMVRTGVEQGSDKQSELRPVIYFKNCGFVEGGEL